jgi:hypothetical protein
VRKQLIQLKATHQQQVAKHSPILVYLHTCSSAARRVAKVKAVAVAV